MSIDSAVESLTRFPMVLANLVRPLGDDIQKFARTSEDWSILQIVCHLADEEEFDFPVRIQLTLDGSQSWPPIDPEGWATERNYSGQNLEEQLERFGALRKSALTQLSARGWEAIDWNSSYSHETIGELSAGDLLHSWAAHDILHLRQISKRLYEYNEVQANSFSTRYAGNW